MKTIIAGSRTHFPSLDEIQEAVDASGFDVTEVVSGCAFGVDQAGERWADSKRIPVKRHHADWNKYGRRAGPIRNLIMADNAEALIAFHKNASRGTQNMIEIAQKTGLKVFVVTI